MISVNSIDNINWKEKYPPLIDTVRSSLNQSIADLIDKNGTDKFDEAQLTNLFINTVFQKYNGSLKENLPIKKLNTRATVFYVHELYNNPDITRLCKISENPLILSSFQRAMAAQFDDSLESMLTLLQKVVVIKKPCENPNFDAMDEDIVFEDMNTKKLEAMKEHQRQLFPRFELAGKIANLSAPVSPLPAPLAAEPAVAFVIPNKTNDQFGCDFQQNKLKLISKIVRSGRFSDLIDRMLLIPAKASQFKESAAYNLDHTVRQFLELVCSGRYWKEFITALAQTPGLTDCVEVFDVVAPSSPLPFVPLVSPPLPIGELKASKPSGYDRNITKISALAPAVSDQYIENHEFYRSRMSQNRETIARSIITSKMVNILITQLPSMEAIRISFEAPDSTRVNQILEWVIESKKWSEFIKGLRHIGLPDLANLFN